MTETKIELTDRWRSEGREAEVAAFRETIRLECRKRGLKKQEANDTAWAEAERNYPPIGSCTDTNCPPAGETDPANHDADPAQPVMRARVSGLDKNPESWGTLPASAPLATELAWVQANRLWIVFQSPNSVTVDLSLAAEPAPSRSALAWLETSIRNYAKFTDVLAKTAQNAIDESEAIRRERMAIAEMERLLEQMAQQNVAVKDPHPTYPNDI